MSTTPSLRRLRDGWHRVPNATGLGAVLLVCLALALVVRVLTDDLSAANSRHSGSLNLSGVIAVLFIVVAFVLLARERRGVLASTLAVIWLLIWTVVALHTSGASTETLREGVRELSVVGLGVIVYNAQKLVTLPIAARMVQLMGIAPALLALYQLATHTGLDVAGNVRANGTFAHPNSAAMFFAIATVATLWLYLDYGRRLFDALLVAIFAAALIATFSIDGLLTLTAMLLVFGTLQPGSIRAKLVPAVVAGLVVLVFFATPLGARRIAGESSTSLRAADRGETTSSLDTRLYRWKTLLPEWERSPVIGQGLGTTTTAEGTSANPLNGLLPHNEYIRYLVETGILGLAILIAALAYLGRSLIRGWRATRNGSQEPFNAPALGVVVVVGCLVNALADNTLLNSPTCYAATLIVASLLGNTRSTVSVAHAKVSLPASGLRTSRP